MTKLTHPLDGVKLKRIRGQKLKTQSEVARQSGVSEASLRIYEAGGASVHASTLIRLARALGVEPEAIRPGGEELEESRNGSDPGPGPGLN